MALTTDVITGFPGETEEEFMTTCNYVTKLEFAKIHVFPYSEREGTAAAKMKDQVRPGIRKERAGKLIEISSGLERKFAESLVGKETHIIVEKVENGVASGYTPWHVRVDIPVGNEHVEQGDIMKCTVREQMFNFT